MKATVREDEPSLLIISLLLLLPFVIFLVTGGFGASANARGSAVFCKNLYDGKNTRYERMDVLGEVKPERMPDWAKEKAAAFSRTIQGKDHER